MKQLRWVQPRWNKRQYELHDETTIIARLEYRGSFKESVSITLDSEELTVRKLGFWRTRYVILRGEQEIAAWNGEGARDQLLFMTGRRFAWKRKSLWSGAYSFIAPDNEVLMTFSSKARWLRSECLITVSPSTDRYPETRLLLAFGWFLMLAQASAATAAAT
jgi:hypothetical protein